MKTTPQISCFGVNKHFYYRIRHKVTFTLNLMKQLMHPHALSHYLHFLAPQEQ